MSANQEAKIISLLVSGTEKEVVDEVRNNPASAATLVRLFERLLHVLVVDFSGQWEPAMANAIAVKTPAKETPEGEPNKRLIRFGMFPELGKLTDEDFEAAEWRPRDDLD